MISETLAQASRRGTVRPAFFLRIDSTPVVTRAWSGVGRRYLPADPVEPVDGATYVGTGFLQNLPDLESLFQGESQALSFTLPGVDARALALVDDAAGDVEGVGAHFGFAFLDARHALSTPVFWVFDGEVDTCGWSDAQGDGGSSRRRTVTLNLVGGWSDRRFRLLQMWTAPDQRLRDPTDEAFDHIASYEAGVTADWPIK